MKKSKKVNNSASYLRKKKLESLTTLALEKYSLEEIIGELWEQSHSFEFKNAVTFWTDELIDKDGSGDIVTIDMTGKGMNCLDKLREFVKAEIFPYVNEQQNCLLFY